MNKAILEIITLVITVHTFVYTLFKRQQYSFFFFFEDFASKQLVTAEISTDNDTMFAREIMIAQKK